MLAVLWSSFVEAERNLATQFASSSRRYARRLLLTCGIRVFGSTDLLECNLSVKITCSGSYESLLYVPFKFLPHQTCHISELISDVRKSVVERSAQCRGNIQVPWVHSLLARLCLHTWALRRVWQSICLCEKTKGFLLGEDSNVRLCYDINSLHSRITLTAWEREPYF